MAPPSIPTLSAHGADMPAIGFGTSSLGDCGEIVASALSLGYRHIDTAWKYGTERSVGEGIRASGVPRNELFLTTKVSHEYLRADDFARSVEQSLKTLGVDFVDLLLVHWPNSEIPLSEPIPALAKAKRQGLARHIGVANFNIAMLDEANRLCPEPLVNLQAAALADPAGQHRSDPTLVERRAHGRESQHLRLCADRRGDGADRGAQTARRQDRQSRGPRTGLGLRWRERTMTPKYFMYFPGNYRWSAAFV